MRKFKPKPDQRRVQPRENNPNAFVLSHDGYYRNGEFIPFERIKEYLRAA